MTKFHQIIYFSGNRRGMNDLYGMRNCAVGLRKLMPLAEKYHVTLVMELRNSKVNHRDYLCDHTSSHFSNPVSGGDFYWKDSVLLPTVKPGSPAIFWQ